MLLHVSQSTVQSVYIPLLMEQAEIIHYSIVENRGPGLKYKLMTKQALELRFPEQLLHGQLY